jgi:hypothetical protein
LGLTLDGVEAFAHRSRIADHLNLVSLVPSVEGRESGSSLRQRVHRIALEIVIASDVVITGLRNANQGNATRPSSPRPFKVEGESRLACWQDERAEEHTIPSQAVQLTHTLILADDDNNLTVCGELGVTLKYFPLIIIPFPQGKLYCMGLSIPPQPKRVGTYLGISK